MMKRSAAVCRSIAEDDKCSKWRFPFICPRRCIFFFLRKCHLQSSDLVNQIVIMELSTLSFGTFKTHFYDHDLNYVHSKLCLCCMHEVLNIKYFDISIREIKHTHDCRTFCVVCCVLFTKRPFRGTPGA